MDMNKRGISDLIASVLVILIVISLFVVVSSFLRKSSEKVMEKGTGLLEKILSCDDVNMEIKRVCYSKNYNFIVNVLSAIQSEGIKDLVGITIQNNNNYEFKEFRLKFSYGDSKVVTPHPESIKPYDNGYIFNGLTSEQGDKLEWIKLYPIINGETCSSKEYKLNINKGEKC